MELYGNSNRLSRVAPSPAHPVTLGRPIPRVLGSFQPNSGDTSSSFGANQYTSLADFSESPPDDYEWAHARPRATMGAHSERSNENLTNPPGDATHRAFQNDDLSLRTGWQIPQASKAESELSGLAGGGHCGLGGVATGRPTQMRVRKPPFPTRWVTLKRADCTAAGYAPTDWPCSGGISSEPERSNCERIPGKRLTPWLGSRNLSRNA